MNGQQKDELRVLDKWLISHKRDFEKLLAQEQVKFDKMGQGLQESSTGAEINIGIQKLKAIIENLDEITDMIGDLI